VTTLGAGAATLVVSAGAGAFVVGFAAGVLGVLVADGDVVTAEAVALVGALVLPAESARAGPASPMETTTVADAASAIHRVRRGFVATSHLPLSLPSPGGDCSIPALGLGSSEQK